MIWKIFIFSPDLESRMTFYLTNIRSVLLPVKTPNRKQKALNPSAILLHADNTSAAGDVGFSAQEDDTQQMVALQWPWSQAI